MDKHAVECISLPSISCPGPLIIGVGRVEHPATSSGSEYLQKDFLPRNPQLAGRQGLPAVLGSFGLRFPSQEGDYCCQEGWAESFHVYCAAAQSAVLAASFLALQVADFPNLSSECEGAQPFIISGFCLVSLYSCKLCFLPTTDGFLFSIYFSKRRMK